MNIELAGKILELNMILDNAVDSRNLRKDMSDYEKKIEDSIYPEDKKIITEKLKPYEEDIKKYFTFDNAQLFMFYIYNYAHSKGINIDSLEEFYKYAVSLTDEELWEVLETSGRDELLEKIANSESYTPEEKWYLVNFILKPREALEKTVELMKIAEEVYNPFYEKYREEREEYRKNFSIKKLSKEITLVNDTFLEYLGEDYLFIVISPIILSLYLTEVHGRKLFALSTRMEEVYSEKNGLLEDDKFFDVLKLLGDESRYSVLQSISKEKTKDLAERLGITSAAVSFHVKKLIVANLLKLKSVEDDDVKYEVNTRVIERVVAKLQKDFLEK